MASPRKNGSEQKYTLESSITTPVETEESKIETRFVNANVLENIYGPINQSITLSFPSQEEAEQHLAWVKQKLSTDYSIQKVKVVSNAFELTTFQLQQLQSKIRKEVLPHPPETDFIIKSLRADDNCFFSDYIKSITPPFVKRPLRKVAKKKITVTGKGVEIRAEKKPHYTPEQKQGYSKSQSSSFGTRNHFPRVFGFNSDRQEVLVGTFLDIKDVLLSHRNYIYDGGTVARGYDFDVLEEAELYARKKVNKVLFSADNLADFKKAIADPKNKDSYNEVMPRQRWNTDGTSQIFIASDTLEARLQAQEYARLVKKRLLEEKAVTEDYSVRIFYYLPSEPNLNFKEYTRVEQELDRLCALSGYQDRRTLRSVKYEENSYQFLFALPREKIKEVLQDEISIEGGKCKLPWHLLREGYVHVLESLADKLGEPIKNIIALADQVNDKEPFAYYNLMRKGYFDIARELIKKRRYRIDFNQYKGNQTLLYLAAQDGNIQLVNELLAHGADCNKICVDGTTPLYGAAKNGHLDVVKTLLAKGAECYKGQAPLYAAAGRGNLAVVEFLLAHGVDCNKGNMTPLHAAAKNGHFDVAKTLLAKGADSNKSIIPPIYAAAEQGHAAIVELLLAHGADGNKVRKGKGALPDTKPLFIAAENGHLAVVKALLAAPGVDCNEARSDGTTPLFIAAKKGHFAIVEVLLAKKADFNKTCAIDKLSSYFLMMAIMSEVSFMMRFKHLLGMFTMKVGNITPLHVAAEEGHDDIAGILLAKGADCNKVCINGATPLLLAVENKHFNVAKRLLEAKADVNAVLEFCSIKTLGSIEQRKMPVLKEFLKKYYQGAIPEKIFPRISALHLAALNGQIEIVALLLQHGANAALKTTNGVSARDFALAMEHHEVAFMLAKYEPQRLLDERDNAFKIIEQFQQVPEEKETDLDKNERNNRLAAFNALDQYAMQLMTAINLRKEKNDSPSVTEKLDLLVELINQAYRNCELENSSAGLGVLLQKLQCETDFIIQELKKEEAKSFLNKFSFFSSKLPAAELQHVQKSRSLVKVSCKQ